MNSKEGLTILVLIWIITLPVFHHFYPFVGEVTDNPSYPPGIDHSTRENRYKNYNQLASKIDENIPVFNVIGNHELKSIENYEEVHNDYYGYFQYSDKPSAAPNSLSPYYWYSWNLNGYHFIALNTNENYTNPFLHGHGPKHFFGGAFSMTKKQIEWLKNNLKKTENPTIVFCHVPLDGYGLTSYDTLTNQEKIRNIFEKSGKVAAVIQGHTHHMASPEYNGYKWVDNGIPYFYLPALGSPLGGPRYSVLNLMPEKKRIEIRTEAIEEVTSLFSDENWNVSYQKNHAESFKIKTSFHVSEGKNHFTLRDLDSDVEYEASIGWENYTENEMGDVANKVLKKRIVKGQSKNFKFKPTESFDFSNIAGEDNKPVKIENVKTVGDVTKIIYSSSSELFKTNLQINNSTSRNVEIAVINDFHSGPKRLELFSQENANRIFKKFSGIVNSQKFNFVVNNGDWIDGHQAR